MPKVGWKQPHVSVLETVKEVHEENTGKYKE